MNAANEGLATARNLICGNPESYGFDNNIQAESVTLGKGYNLYYPNKDKIESINTDNLLELCDLSGFWVFIVKADNKAKTFLTVGFEEGKYRMVAFGGDSQVFDESLTSYKKLSNIGNPDIVKIRNIYYLVNKVKTGELVLPSISKENSTEFKGINNTKLADSKEIIKELKSINNNFQDGQRSGSTLPSNKQNSNMILIVILSLVGIATLSTFYFKRKNKIL